MYLYMIFSVCGSYVQWNRGGDVGNDNSLLWGTVPPFAEGPE